MSKSKDGRREDPEAKPFLLGRDFTPAEQAHFDEVAREVIESEDDALRSANRVSRDVGKSLNVLERSLSAQIMARFDLLEKNLTRKLDDHLRQIIAACTDEKDKKDNH